MSFWDIANDVSTDIQSLITADNPDYDAILQNPELLRTFIAQDGNLFNFLLNPTTFNKIISIMMTHENIKISKTCVELFVAKDSPLMKKLISDQSLSTTLINLSQNSLNSNDLVRIGFVSRIYQKASETIELQNDFIKLFNTKLEILSFLTKVISNTSAYDLILSYLTIQKPEDQWLLFAYLQMILPKGKSANCPKCFFKYKDSILGLIKSISTFKFTQNHKENIIHLMMEIFGKEKLPDVVDVFSANISFIYDAETSNNEIKYLLLTLAAMFPPQKAILNISAKLIQKTTSENYGPLENAALNIISLSPSKTLTLLIPTIIDKFTKDTTNTFHHLAFLNFVKQSMKVPELQADLLKKLPPLILENAEASKWRQNANRVAFYLELANILDEVGSSKIISENDKWKSFKDYELLKWRKRKEGLDEAPEAVAQSKHGIDAAKEDIDIATTKNQVETKNVDSNAMPQFNFPDMNNGSDNQKPEKVEFPEFPEINATGIENNHQEKVEFPEFPDMSNEINSSNSQKQENPAFPEFPSFQNENEQPKEEKVVFPEFTTDDTSKTNDNGFSFPPIDNNNDNDNQPEKVEFGFPTEDEPKQNNMNSFAASFSQTQPQKAAAFNDDDGDESFEHFMELVNNPCWEYHGPSPEELFGQKDRFASPDDAFQFLINQT